MLISVVVPVYNVEKYLRQCLDSILHQTYKQLEVILVNDGSKDSSGKICEEYASKYENFRVVHKQNEGLGMARNTGLACIAGEYVTFVDADDYLCQDCIEKLYNVLVEYDADVCKGGFRRVLNSGKEVSRRQYKREIFEGDDVKNKFLPRMIGSSPSQRDSVEMGVCGALYKTKIIKENHLEFLSERKLISEDLVFNIDYMQYASSVYMVPDVGYNYRVTEGSLTQSYRMDRFKACKYFYCFVKERLINIGYDYDIILRLQRMFFVYIKICISQENRMLSGNNKKECMYNIEKICRDKLVQDIISEYPKKKLGLRQNIFLLLIKYNFKQLLFFLSEMKFF